MAFLGIVRLPGELPPVLVVETTRFFNCTLPLNESMDSFLKQVYYSLQEDSRKGNFVSLSNSDRDMLEINMTDEEIKEIPKKIWKKYVKKKQVRHIVF